jgi:hypothetical protein
MTAKIAPDPYREEEIESRWEAAPAVATVIGFQLVLATVSRIEHWTLWTLPWWVWLISIPPELALLIPLAWSRPRHRLEQLGLRRMVALALLGVISLTNALLLVALIGSLVEGKETSGAQLLQPDSPSPDFQFPQMENPQLVAPGWYPELVDYIYVSFTNSIAFSPTDAMPLTRRAKLLMMFESAISAITILLVAARAVNIFK